MYGKTGSGKAVSMPLGLSIGLAYSMAIMIAGIAVSAKLIQSEILEQHHVGYCIIVILIGSGWIGANRAWKKIKRRKLAVCVLSGGLLFGILLITNALIFGGNYSGAGESGLLILCGNSLAILSEIEKKGRKRKVYNR